MGSVCLNICMCILLMMLPVMCNPCSTDCQSCTTNGGLKICTSCSDGYWPSGSSCLPCANNCATCSDASSCSTCKPGFYAPTSICISKCSTNCLDGLCDENTGYCTVCSSERYGYHCDFDCKRCKNEQCDLRQCTNECESGYWPYKEENYTECRPCVDNCSSCANSSICNVCKDGTYLSLSSQTKNYCLLCPSTCEKCSIFNVCSVCKPGYYGTACDFVCSARIAGCHLCEWNSAFTVTCSQCDNGWTLQDNTCQEVPYQCPETCKRCSGNNVCETCKTGWVGALCDESCHDISHCVACHELDGSIVCNVCDEGYAVMNGECSAISTKTKEAVQLSSTTYTPASMKTTSVRPILTTPTTKASTFSGQGHASNQDGNKFIMIGGIAGSACVLLIAGVILTVCVIKRRKTKHRNNQHVIAADGQRMEEDLTDYPVYAKPNKMKLKQQTVDYIYAQPNKVKKSNEQRTDDKDVSEPSSHNNVTISFGMEAVVMETDVDELQLETLEGELTTEIEMVDITSSDTYYNVEGLLRSRIEVTNLLEYVRKKTDFDSEFQKLPKGLQRSCNEALKTHNRKKNRFNGIYAYDATRVVLGSKSYINANHIDGHNQSNAYIASLGPTSDTMNKFSTFWEMIWQEGVEAIVMLTNLEEHGKMKCEQYWPNPGKTKTCHDYILKCGAENVFAEFAVRELTLERNGFSERRSLIQYHYTAWPDRYVPDTVASLVEFRDKVEQTKRRTKSPLVVHCSAGIGRTGTYIALDLLINEGRDCNYVDLFGCALGLRGQRVNLIQNEEQYEYLHHAVLYSLSCYTEPISVTSVKNQMTDQRISAQFKAMKALPVPSKRLLLLTSNYADRKENRTGADIPCDSHRVRTLSTKNNYINAVFVNGYQRKNAYIAAQTPMPSTIEDFMSMVYAERCSIIVSFDEENPTLKSVAQYLPAVNGTSMFGQYQVHNKGIQTYDDFIVRDVVISKTLSEQLNIQHYEFRKWTPDDIVPSSTKAFMKLVTEVDSTVKNQQSNGPILLHCLTGSQRCGVFCAVSTMMDKLTLDRQMCGVHTFCHIRSRRNTALHKQEVFKFCYQCVADSIDSSSDRGNYYNVLSFKR